MRLEYTNQNSIKARNAQARLLEFRRLFLKDNMVAANYLCRKVAKQGYARSEDFQLLGTFRGAGEKIRNPFYYTYVVSECPHLRQHLSQNEQELFWKAKLSLAGLWLEDRERGVPILDRGGVLMEKGLTLAELEIPLTLLLSESITPRSRLALAHLLMIFRYNEITALLKGTIFEPEITSSKSLIYSKRYKDASPFIRNRAHLELASDFLQRPEYRVCPDAEWQIIKDFDQGHFILLDKYILYNTYHQVGICLRTFANAEGQIFVPGVIYGTNSANDFQIEKKAKLSGILWQPIRAWNPFNKDSITVKELAERYLIP